MPMKPHDQLPATFQSSEPSIRASIGGPAQPLQGLSGANRSFTPPSPLFASLTAAKAGSASGPIFGGAPTRETPVGYAHLLVKYGINDYQPSHLSYLSDREYGSRKVEVDRHGQEREVLPRRTAVGASDADHLAFAMRYDGVDLELLRRVLPHMPKGELAASIRNKPQGEYHRRMWFLAEWLTGEPLDVPGLDVTKVRAIPLLDPDKYVTCEVGRSRRHQVIVNSMGDQGWCPIVRRSMAIQAGMADKILEAKGIMADQMSAEFCRRVSSFLIARESLTSYEIEGELPDVARHHRFLQMLTKMNGQPITDEMLHGFQKGIIGTPGPQDGRYRDDQVWIGARDPRDPMIAKVEYIPPQPKDVPELMSQFILSANHLVDKTHQGAMDPIVAASVISNSFVYIHPYRDGNGRISRLLIQNGLRAGDRSADDLILPVSAAIERDRKGYYETLNLYSAQIMKDIKYDMSGKGEVRVHGETKDLYRYPDLTKQTEAMFRWSRDALHRDVSTQKTILHAYDSTHEIIQNIGGLDHKSADLFFAVCQQNEWKLSKGKREKIFKSLSDEQVSEMVKALQDAVGRTP